MTKKSSDSYVDGLLKEVKGVRKMNRLFRLVAAIALVSLATGSSVMAQGKIRIAIWDFENNSERSWWFSSDLGPAARNHIDTAFSESDLLSERFSIIEREKLDLVLKEQGLSTSGALDQQTAAQVGKVLGLKYILTGGIDRFAINTTKGGFGGIGGKYTKAEAKINIRLIDTTTAERIVAVSEEGDVKKGGGVFKGASLSREDEWGIASEAIEKTALKLVEKFEKHKGLKKLAAGGAMGGTEGKVIKVDGNRAWLNMGSMSGIEVGDSFAVMAVGDALVDPDTGMVLGTDETEVGTGQVVDVQERFSIMEFTGKAAPSDVVRKQ